MIKSKLQIKSNVNEVLKARGYKDVEVIYAELSDLQSIVRGPRLRNSKADAASMFGERFGIMPHIYLHIVTNKGEVVYPPPNYYPLSTSIAVVFRMDCTDLAKCQEAYELFKNAYGMPPDPLTETLLELPPPPPAPRREKTAEEEEAEKTIEEEETEKTKKEEKERQKVKKEDVLSALNIPIEVVADMAEAIAKHGESAVVALKRTLDDLIRGSPPSPPPTTTPPPSPPTQPPQPQPVSVSELPPAVKKLASLPSELVDFILEERWVIEKLARMKATKPKLYQQLLEALETL